MMEKKIDTSIVDSVMKEIHEKNIKMRPRMYFVLSAIAFGVGLAGVFMTSIFFANLVFFHLRVEEPFGFLFLGSRGYEIFFRRIPWFAIFASLIGTGIGMVLLKKLDITYRKSFTTISIIAICIVFLTAIAVDLTGMNDLVRSFQKFRPLYRERFLEQDFVIGKIIAINDGSIEVHTPERRSITIITSRKTLLPFGRDFQKGEPIRAVGVFDENENFIAEGIAKVSRHMQKRFPKMMNDDFRR